MPTHYPDRRRMAICGTCGRLVPLDGQVTTHHFKDSTGGSRALCPGSQHPPRTPDG